MIQKTIDMVLGKPTECNIYDQRTQNGLGVNQNES